jgi:hypothetical protein
MTDMTARATSPAGCFGHDGAQVVIGHAVLSFTDGICEEIIKRYVGTDGLWQIAYGQSRNKEPGEEVRDPRSEIISDSKIAFEIVQSSIRHLVSLHPLIKRFGSPSTSSPRSARGESRRRFRR